MSGKHIVLLSFASRLPLRHVMMLRSLKARGWRVSVVAWDRNLDDNLMISTEHSEIVDHWQRVCVSASLTGFKALSNLPQYYLRLWQVLVRLDKPDLILLPHIFLLPLVLFLRGKKIYDALEMYAIDLSFHFGPLRHLMRLVISLFEGLFVTRADGILTVDSKGGWLERFYRRWNRQVQVIWNVPSKMDDPDAEDIEALKSQYAERKVVAFVGGLVRKKGLQVALGAAALVKERHPDSLFLFIGPMRDDTEAIERLIRAGGGEANVRFLGPMPYRDLLAHLRHAQVGLALHQQDRIYPYVSAGNGRKFFSYMQAGVAIIGPNFGEIGRAVEMADCGLLVDTEKADTVSEAITRLLNEPEEARRMGGNGRRAFEEHFNWEIEEQKFLSFLDQVVD